MIYLYVKTHNKTGLKYLGKTIKDDPYSYTGSGTYWLRHLKLHGFDFTTQILLATESLVELKETGIFFSKLWNIVESNEWANLMFEAGDGGRQEALLKAGKHNFQNSDVQRKIQLNRIAKGTHNLQSKNRTFSKKGCKHEKTRLRNLSESNKFRNNVPCINAKGNSVMISSDIYHTQSGDKSTWEYVHTKSKEAKIRRNLVSNSDICTT